jgi:hypothetical protein
MGQVWDIPPVRLEKVHWLLPSCAAVAAGRALGPHHRVVMPGPATFVVIGQLIAGQDGHQPPPTKGASPEISPRQHSTVSPSAAGPAAVIR